VLAGAIVVLSTLVWHFGRKWHGSRKLVTA
jgi:hypothetical protein